MNLRAVTLVTSLLVPAASSLAFAAGDKSGHGNGDDPSGLRIPVDGAIAQLSAASDTKNAKLSLVFSLAPPDTESDEGASQYLSVGASTPLEQGASYGNFATLDELTKSTAFTLKYLYATSKNRVVADRTSPAFLQQCYALLAKVKGDTTKACTVGRVDAAFAALNKAGQSPDTLRREVIAGLDSLKTMQKPVLESMWLYGLNGTLGYDQHKYFDPNTLGAGNLTRLSFDVGASITYVFAKGQASVNLSADYQNSFRDNGSARIQCTTTTSPITSCVNGYFGAPTRIERDLFSADVRFIVKPFGFPVGLNPKVTYDVNSNSEAVQLPIYFITNTSGGLSGGIRYDWNSENHVSVIGVFASAAFSILKAED